MKDYEVLRYHLYCKLFAYIYSLIRVMQHVCMSKIILHSKGVKRDILTIYVYLKSVIKQPGHSALFPSPPSESWQLTSSPIPRRWHVSMPICQGTVPYDKVRRPH